VRLLEAVELAQGARSHVCLTVVTRDEGKHADMSVIEFLVIGEQWQFERASNDFHTPKRDGVGVLGGVLDGETQQDGRQHASGGCAAEQWVAREHKLKDFLDVLDGWGVGLLRPPGAMVKGCFHSIRKNFSSRS
jgi:hypothetical protein